MISRRLWTLLLPAVLALAIAGCRDSPTSPSVITAIAFGDSITFGVGTTGSNNYVARLSARTGVPIENSGRPGDTTADALGRLEGSVVARDADIVMVLLGGNDILQGLAPLIASKRHRMSIHVAPGAGTRLPSAASPSPSRPTFTTRWSAGCLSRSP